MTTQFQTESATSDAFASYFRTVATPAAPITRAYLRRNSVLRIACDATATATVDVSISDPSLPDPAFTPAAALGTNGIVAPGEVAVSEVGSKFSLLRVSVTGGNAVVEVLE